MTDANAINPSEPPLPGEPDFPAPGQSPDGVVPYAPLGDLLDRLENVAGDDRDLCVGSIVDDLGETAVTPLVLLIAILMVSPLSGIPLMPTLSSIILLTLNVQSMFGRNHLWLPDWLRRRQIPHGRLTQAIGWLRKPCAYIDRHSQPRFAILTYGPMRLLAFIVCLAIPLTWPFLEILPFVTSIGALALALVAFGRMTRDGLFLLLGYSVVGGAVGLGFWVA
ncbi:exopolysaccharide biosynthesis protein [Chachezhania sediminis]|uniref:exopolysaccharide biosynthesis protein n=1 Tax=Chachezhania sediminis TaxID=2599291 RepID=UPI00131A6BD1|nr:exopolysaccharide biosynthesis protein [Chachezhania sediminis]